MISTSIQNVDTPGIMGRAHLMKKSPYLSKKAVPSVACFTVLEQLFCSKKRSSGVTEIAARIIQCAANVQREEPTKTVCHLRHAIGRIRHIRRKTVISYLHCRIGIYRRLVLEVMNGV